MCKVYILVMFWIADFDSSCNLPLLSSWPTSQSMTSYPNGTTIFVKTIDIQFSNGVSPNKTLLGIIFFLYVHIKWIYNKNHFIINLEDTQSLRDIKGWKLNKGDKFSCPLELDVINITQLSPIFSSLVNTPNQMSKFNMRDIHHPNNELWPPLE